MACWMICRDDERVRLFYDNLVTGERQNCGSLGRDVDDQMVLGWIFNEARPHYWDRIYLSDGRMLVFQKSEALA